MKFILLLIVGLILGACTKEPFNINSSDVDKAFPRVEIGFRINSQFNIVMFVYNPNSYSICIDDLLWPEFGSDIFQVVKVWNRDGTQWRYIGSELFPLGYKPKEIKAHTLARTSFSIKGAFNPPSDFSEPYIITYSEQFTNCEN